VFIIPVFFNYFDVAKLFSAFSKIKINNTLIVVIALLIVVLRQPSVVISEFSGILFV